MNIAEGKQFLRDNWEAGCTCPCCGQMVKLYKRKLNTAMTCFLIALYRAEAESGRPWHHAKQVLGQSFSMDYAQLRHWGLIAEAHNNDPAKRNSGFWQITEKGRQFVLGAISVPSHVHLYNNTVIGWGDTQVTVKECLSSGFDYQELMGFKTIQGALL